MDLKIEEQVSLKPYHTFHVDINARYLCRISSINDLLYIIQNNDFEKVPKIILGGGSDVLFVGDYDGLIIKDETRGIDQVYENDEYVWVKAESGENWHNFVKYCVEHNWGGVENLALIPGTVGAAPIQNIGAYGVELKDSLHSVEVLDMSNGEEDIMMNEELNFGYRWSTFKEEKNKGKYFINSVTFKLRKEPECNISYKGLALELKGEEPDIQKVFDAVVSIRSKKLPDPDKIGNAGSFFKNPVVSKERFEELIKAYPNLNSYPAGDQVKLPAAQLIDMCGWKGVVKNQVGVYQNQALVICNYGGAKGSDIRDFALEIQRSVKSRFEVDIQPEVNIIS